MEILDFLKEIQDFFVEICNFLTEIVNFREEFWDFLEEFLFRVHALACVFVWVRGRKRQTEVWTLNEIRSNFFFPAKSVIN